MDTEDEYIVEKLEEILDLRPILGRYLWNLEDVEKTIPFFMKKSSI